MTKNAEAHRPGVWKQDNKTHKHGRHKSKGAIDAANRGRATVKQITTKKKQNLNRMERKNQMLQLRAKKREETVALKRALGKPGCPPFLVAIVALNPLEDITAVVELLKSCDDSAIVNCSPNDTLHICIPRFKQRFSFITPRQGHLDSILDAAKVADTLMFIHSSDVGYEEDIIFTALFAQGLPTTVHVISEHTQWRDQKRNEKMKLIKQRLEKRFPKEKLLPLSTPQEAVLLVRQIGNQKQRPVAYRNHRFHLLAEEIDFQLNAETGSEGTLKVTGYVRGRPLDVNGLVHIPGYGSFQLKQIDELCDPHANSSARALREMDEVPNTVAVSDIRYQQTLQSENVPDAIQGEQTWPTEEELADAESARKVTKKVPKGTSDYQAAWIVDSENEGEGDDDDDDESDDSEGDVSMDDSFKTADSDSDSNEDDEDESGKMYDTESHQSEMNEDYDAKFDVDMEEKEMEKFKEAKRDEMFPDEVDTPVDKPAKIRFQKYRGLKSFRTSPWDPKENLPSDYSRIFQFENFERTRKNVLKSDVDGVQVGRYVTLHIVNVPKLVHDSLQSSTPLVVYGLLNHEQKMSVLNMLIRRIPYSEEETEPIKSKEKLIFHVGYQRFLACPIFSQHTNGDKHKYERYFRDDKAIVATVFAPIAFSPCPVLVFKEMDNGEQKLIATGSVLSVNPDRIITKRIVLSGSPFKINRKSAVVRYMFFNRDDINWFKPVELRTKYGRRGHIKEPLGTHGHMKCVFNGQLQSQDTVLLNLYKRVYPKWTYDPCTAGLD